MLNGAEKRINLNIAIVLVASLAFALLLVATSFACAERAYAESLSVVIANLESDISTLEDERAKLETELDEINSSIEEVEKTSQAYRESESNYRKLGYDSVIALYKIDNSPSLLLDSLLDADSFTDALKRIEYFELARNKCVNNIEEIKQALTDLEKRKTELTEKQNTVSADLEDKNARIEQAQNALEAAKYEFERNPGRRIAAAAVALAGCESKNNSAPGPASYYGATERTTKNARIAPPRKCAEGDWSTYLDVYSKISNGHNVPNHACCDCLPVLAVLWSGVDDDYLNGHYPTYESEFQYLSNSPKWDRVGGDNGYWYKNPKNGDNQVELQPGDILVMNNPSKNDNHWMIYVGHDIAANRWGETTVVDCVDEGYRVRWANGKPLSSRKEAKWMVFRRNTTDYDPDSSKWSDFMKEDKERYL